MRVIAGDAKGRRLVAPQLAAVRPTSDRVREAIFDILEARDLVTDARFVDLFAGSGALGIEALSRGARSVTFVERDRRALVAIDANLAATGYSAPQARVVRSDVETWVASHGNDEIDVVVADPPYDFTEWRSLLGGLSAATLLFEHRGTIETNGIYEISREYRYGGTLVTLFKASNPRSLDDEDSD